MPNKKVLPIGLLFLLVFSILNFAPQLFRGDISYSINADTHFLSEDTEYSTPTLSNIEPKKKTVYDSTTIEANIKTNDKRVYVLDQYFLNYGSPLYGTGKYFVDACKKFGAPEDCIVVAAIAKHETNLCKYNNSAQVHNCWGFGGPGIHRIRFNNFQEAIDRVTNVLVNQYGISYMNNPSLMERTFCGTEDPLCPGWGNRVKSIMNEINRFSVDLGMGDLYSLRTK